MSMTSVETIEILEEMSAEMFRALRRSVQQPDARDAGAMEYDSWTAKSSGAVEYDSWPASLR